jgi:hypothetical protein
MFHSARPNVTSWMRGRIGNRLLSVSDFFSWAMTCTYAESCHGPDVGDDLGAGIAAMKLFERPVVAGGKPDIELEVVPTRPQALCGADYSRLANECFLLAAIARDPKAAAELIEKGDKYLRPVLDGAVRREEV